MNETPQTEEQEIIPPAPEGTPNDDEKELVRLFGIAKEEVKILEANLEAAKARLEGYELRLLKLLEDDEKRSSAKYEESGHVTIIEGKVYASIEKGRQADVLDYLRNVGREDMIKTTVHSATLTAYVNQCLQQNDPLPPGVTHYRPKWLNFYKSK